MSAWSLGAVGDVFVNRDDPEKAFTGAADLLHRLDLVFGNCEGAYTDQPHFAPSSGWRVHAPSVCGEGLGAAGFDVMALANNHILDAGHEGLADTMNLLRGQRIRTVGAGDNLAEARRPVVVEQAGVRVGFLSYASVYQAGYEAKAAVPGLSPFRVHSHYYIPDWDAYGKVEPGVRPEVRTLPFPEDMEEMVSAISGLRADADVVIVSHHWGNAGGPATISDYEKIVGRAAVDAGADVVLGHHHHFLRGVEVYKGKPIYYGLGHFVFDFPGMETKLTRFEIEKLEAMGEYAIYPREGYPLSPFHPDARMTMVAVCRFEDATLAEFGFAPCLIDQNNFARPLEVGTGEWARLVDYMRAISSQAGIASDYEDNRFVTGLDLVRVCG